MVKSFRDILRESKSVIREITVQDLQARLSAGRPPVVLDVREQDEYDDGHIPASLFLPRGTMELHIEESVPTRDAPIAIICAGGVRSALAARTLAEMGYTDVASVAGGFTAWRRAGFAVEAAEAGGRRPSSRYSRHILLPEVGEAGQKTLLSSKVLIIGAGGLGSPCAVYLAAVGVGTLGIADDDVVDESNLQRQILHSTLDVGRPKIDSARDRIRALNPDVRVETYRDRITSENVFSIISGYSLVINGCDNFPTRYLMNDACHLKGIPLVDGSIFRFEGQSTVFVPGQGPCYRCLYPEPPPPDMAPSCNEAGVLGVLPGIVGCIQATEAIKILLGKGDPLVGRLLLFDALTMKFREVKTRKDPSCPLCGTHPTITELIDYAGFCAGVAHGS